MKTKMSNEIMMCPSCNEEEAVSINPYKLCDLCKDIFDYEFQIDVEREAEFYINNQRTD